MKNTNKKHVRLLKDNIIFAQNINHMKFTHIKNMSYAIMVLMPCTLNAQLNIIAPEDGVKEYTVANSEPYDSLVPFYDPHFTKFPGQTLFMHGSDEHKIGYYDAFFTGNILKGKHEVYRQMEGRTGYTDPEAVTGKYYDVIKVWTQPAGKYFNYCLLLRDNKTGEDIYFKPGTATRAFTCVGFYDKMKTMHVGSTFEALGTNVNRLEGGIIRTEKGEEYRCIDIGLEMNKNDGAFIILENSSGDKVKSIPFGRTVTGFVSKDIIKEMTKSFGDKFGPQIARGDIDIAMTEEMVATAWGRPYRVEQAEVKGKTFNYWYYPDNRYVTFQNGKVLRIQQIDSYW